MTIEAQLIRAHIELEITREDANGSKAVPIARYGACEVSLVEFSGNSLTNTFVFWIELFDHIQKVAIDSAGANDVEEAVTLAEELVSQAKQLGQKK
jgi:hypothetical protein